MSSRSIRVFEVGVRDGLQNESRKVTFEQKIWLIRSLLKAGVRDLELGAFVRTDKVPQMADTDRIYKAIEQKKLDLGKSHAWCLVPNRVGLQRAFALGVRRIAVFTAATDSFTLRNIGMTIQGSLREFRELMQKGRDSLGSRFHVRGYVSTAFGCPFEGRVSASKALRVIEKLADLGVDEVSIGDTIGVATPNEVRDVIKPALKAFGADRIAVHFHDTRGIALANTLRALELGVTTVDSSVGGLGGCPFAPGATGNLATEDLVYMLNGMGIKTGIDIDSLCKASLEFSRRIKRPLTSRYLQAFAADRRL